MQFLQDKHSQSICLDIASLATVNAILKFTPRTSWRWSLCGNYKFTGVLLETWGKWVKDKVLVFILVRRLLSEKCVLKNNLVALLVINRRDVVCTGSFRDNEHRKLNFRKYCKLKGTRMNHMLRRIIVYSICTTLNMRSKGRSSRFLESAPKFRLTNIG